MSTRLFSAHAGTICNTLDKLIRLYDRNGEEIPFTYCLSSGDDRRVKFEGNGIFHDHDNLAVNDGFLRTKQYSIDNGPGYIILAKGKDKYIAGALSPAYEESHNVWLKHISECLDAGVDGVDLRVGNHNRSQEFERYGFELPVVEEYKKRYGIDITKEEFNPELHREILGEFYTSFYRKASALIRASGKKVQIHIGSHLVRNNKFERYMNFNWEWEKWLADDMADAITIKDGGLVDPVLWKTIKSRMPDNRHIPAFYCPYWKSIPRFPAWPEQFLKTLEMSQEIGQNGLVLYETAAFLKAVGNHKFELLNPELPGLFQKLT